MLRARRDGTTMRRSRMRLCVMRRFDEAQPLLVDDPPTRWRRTHGYRCLRNLEGFWPVCTTTCADCSAGTIRLGEWYDVHDAVWEAAWRGRRKWWHDIRGQAVLCIGCLEQRLGRTLVASDFTAAPCNNPNKVNISERLRVRLTATESMPLRCRRGRPKGSKNKLGGELERVE
jgi:hypothetical protein